METKPKEVTEKALQKVASGPVMSRSLVPKSIDEGMKMAGILAKSNVVPKEMVAKPESIFLAIALGMEIGLPPVQAVSSIMVVNGRPSIWGDALKAVVLGSTVCESFDEDTPDKALKQGFGRCKVKRTGMNPIEIRFSVDDAKRAGLWNKSGPWQQYPGRMLMYRARSWACRDAFPDVLKGIQMREESQDYTQKYETTPMPEPISDEGSTGEALGSPESPQNEGGGYVATPEAQHAQPEPEPGPSGVSPEIANDPISEGDRKELFALIRKKKITLDNFKKALISNWSIRTTADIRYGQLEKIHEWIDQQ